MNCITPIKFLKRFIKRIPTKSISQFAGRCSRRGPPGLAGTEGTAADADADAPSVPSVPASAAAVG